MSCCSKNANEIANKMEEKVNVKGRDTIPLPIKIGLIIVSSGAIALYFF